MNERDDRGLIYLVLNQMNLRNKEDEYFDVGLVGLAKGIKTYDESLGFKRSTYYTRCIKNEICRELVSERLPKREGRKYEISLNKYINKEEEEDELIELIPDKNKDTEKEALLKIQGDDLKYCIEFFLTKKQRNIIKAHYYDELTVDEIAKKYNITHQMVHVHMKAAYRRLKRKMLEIAKIREEKERAEAYERQRRIRENKSIEELLGF